MAAKYIEKTHKNKNKVEVTRRYRIDPEFKPKKIDDISQEFIENYVEANNKGEWLLEVIDMTEKHRDKETKEVIGEFDISFMTVRKLFAEEFFPEIIKGKKEKEPTWNERMRAKFSEQ